MNILRNTTALAQWIWERYVDEDGVAVDATCGNGHDTRWLAERFRKVYAFDIQSEAVEATKRLLLESGMENAEVILDSHHKMDAYVTEPCGLIVFNLGYLPGAAKTVTTLAETTLAAMEKSLSLLARGGLLSVLIYHGHDEGKSERAALLDWAAGLDKSTYHCLFTDMINQPNNPPEILLITKK